MWRIGVLIGLLVSLLALPVFAVDYFPKLSDALNEDVYPVNCPGDILIRAGFEEKDGRYGLMYFGPVEVVDGKLIEAYPHVWIRYEGETPSAVHLVPSKGTLVPLSIEKLKDLYPTLCDLSGGTKV